MARLAAALALVALLAATAAAQGGPNLNLLKGAGASLIPNSNVGFYTASVSPTELKTLVAKDRTKFLTTYQFALSPTARGAPGSTFEFGVRPPARVLEGGAFVLEGAPFFNKGAGAWNLRLF